MFTRWIAFFVFFFAVAGCSPPEEVRTYTAKKDPETLAPEAKEGPTEVKPLPAETGEFKSRMLGAWIKLPTGYSIFVKFHGPFSEVTEHEKAFEAFLASLRLDDANQPPAYNIPSGFQSIQPRMFESKRLKTPSVSGAAVTISEPTRGGELDNYNRWRGQVGLENVPEAELSKLVTAFKVGQYEAKKVDLKGPAPFSSKAMRGPFEK
ncbi:MAG: hypothetical protein ACRC8S_05730 [Fimbriiglobus sp.]